MLILHALPPVLETRLAAALAGRGVTLVRPGVGQPNGPDPGATVMVIAGPMLHCDAARLASLPALRGIVAPGSGTDMIDLQAAGQRNLPVAHAPTPENITGMAEATVMLMLAASFDLPSALARMQGEAPRRARMLAGQTVGLIGLGRIAGAVAERLGAWQVRLLGHGRGAAPEGVTRTDLPDLLRQSDIVSLHASAAANSAPLIGRTELSLMKPGAILVNTARGSLLDEVALAEALHAGRLGGAALDVFVTEPLPVDSALRTCPRVILTPHCVGQTDAGHAALAEALVGNVTRLLDGRAPLFPRNESARNLPG